MSQPESFDDDKSHQRNAIRFAPDPGTIGEVSVKIGKNTLSLYGLVINESRTGCAMVLLCDEEIKEDMMCVCRVDKLPNTAAVFRWVKVLEPGIYKVGLEYLLT